MISWQPASLISSRQALSRPLAKPYSPTFAAGKAPLFASEDHHDHPHPPHHPHVAPILAPKGNLVYRAFYYIKEWVKAFSKGFIADMKVLFTFEPPHRHDGEDLDHPHSEAAGELEHDEHEPHHPHQEGHDGH